MDKESLTARKAEITSEIEILDKKDFDLMELAKKMQGEQNEIRSLKVKKLGALEEIDRLLSN